MTLFTNKTEALAYLAWVGATHLLAGLVHLFQNNLVVDQNTLESALTEADYDGYAAEAITWHVASIDDTGTPELVSDQVIFRPTGTTTPNTVYGAYVKTAAGAYVAVGNTDGPIPMNATTDELTLVLRWRFGENPIVVVVS